MKNSVAWTSFAVLAIASCASLAEPRVTRAQAAQLLNKQAVSSLGVSVRALTFLFSAQPGTLLLKDEFIRDGSWGSLQRLERAGYVKLKVARSTEGEFLQISLTPQGRMLRDALGGL